MYSYSYSDDVGVAVKLLSQLACSGDHDHSHDSMKYI